MTQQIIVDSCGWVAIIDANINFELELERMFGTFELILLDSVLIELESLEIERPKRKSLLLELLKQKSVPFQANEQVHTDDVIFDLANSYGHAVLTVDKDLKKRLYQLGITVVEVVKGQHLKLIDGI
tara:strand:+ start:1304 stop:1684 length:381 start_codon:yes stop_codon:yes gene_type:complete